MELSRFKNCPIQVSSQVCFLSTSTQMLLSTSTEIEEKLDKNFICWGKSFSSPLFFQKVHVCALDEHVIYFVQMSMKIIATLTQMLEMILSCFSTNYKRTIL